MDVEFVLKGEAPQQLYVLGDDGPPLGQDGHLAVLALEQHGGDLVARWCSGLPSGSTMTGSIVAEAGAGRHRQEASVRAGASSAAYGLMGPDTLRE